MEFLNGIAVSPGYAIGEAWVLDARDPVFTTRFIQPDDVPGELERFKHAIEQAQAELRMLVDRVDAKIGHEAAPIFQAHIAMLSDGSLVREVEHRIQNNRFSAEYAVHRTIKYFKKLFLESGNQHLAQRVGDLSDIERGLLTAMHGQRVVDFKSLDHPVILVARDLTPAQTAMLDKSRVLGFATDLGGSTGHTAIVARARDIPGVVGLGTVAEEVSNGDRLIIDGQHGYVIVNPDSTMEAKYAEYREAYRAAASRRSSDRALPAVTRDGCAVRLNANIEFPDEIESAMQFGAEGVGLYRTEFLYVNQEDPNALFTTEPGEARQFDAYRQSVEALGGKSLTLRTMDLGADKFFHKNASFAPKDAERNPAMGLRAVRYCLQNTDLFRNQLRAICRASAFGPVNLMIPMISGRDEIDEVKRILHDVQDELSAEDVDFDPDMPLGIMVEVPSVAVDIDRYVDHVDFLSIGTNDLIQYLLAVDRTNSTVSNLYCGGHPAVLRLIKRVLDVARRADVPASLCGAMAAEPEFVAPLLGMGLRSFSVSPPMIPLVKDIVRNVTLEAAEDLAEEVLALSTAREVMARLAAFNVRK